MYVYVRHLQQQIQRRTSGVLFICPTYSFDTGSFTEPEACCLLIFSHPTLPSLLPWILVTRLQHSLAPCSPHSCYKHLQTTLGFLLGCCGSKPQYLALQHLPTEPSPQPLSGSLYWSSSHWQTFQLSQHGTWMRFSLGQVTACPAGLPSSFACGIQDLQHRQALSSNRPGSQSLQATM